MKKIIILVLPLSAILMLAQTVHGQDHSSNTVVTKVGSPPISSGGGGSASGSDTIRIAQDIKSAYDSCNSGDTHDTTGNLSSCLRDQLSSYGYDQGALNAFETRRKSSIADGCTQCVGYIGLILTLMSGSTNTLPVAAASDVVSQNSITAGSIIFTKLPDGEPLLPGDIGAHGGGFGHILMVNTVEGNIKFTALESNGNFDCRVTSNRSINRDGYVFFRKS